jgi:hypothetical protein
MHTPIYPDSMQYPDNTMFDWGAKREVAPSLWQLENFLNKEWYTRIKNDYRRTESLWSSRYPNRLVMENNHWLNAIMLGAALTPYLEELTGERLNMATARGYLDLSGAYFYPHYDSSQWVVNVQIYLTDVDRDELGTQFILDKDINSTIKEELGGDKIMELVPDEKYYTVPFRQNWGYINDNRERKLHKTRPVPPAFARESLHFNYGLRQGNETGLAGVAEWAITGQNQVMENWHQAMTKLNSVDGLREWLILNTNFHEGVG